ncbi:phosphate uptake regulator PhoU [Halocatena halophila]|uniref:phosphate uptake regulator PhoU n=1 Tax=Halocatena halophila TaxID=2814576 RepID=UPI002ED55FA9
METRKVQLSGGTTYTVSLPKTWAIEQNIEAGVGLQLYPQPNGSLRIETAPNDRARDRTATVSVRSIDAGALTRTIEAFYLVGVDSISLIDETNADRAFQRTIAGAISELSGLEILETTEERVVLQNLIDAGSLSVHKSVLRLNHIALAMVRDAIDALLTGDTTLRDAVVGRKTESEKLFGAVLRFFWRSLSNLQAVERLGTSRTELFGYAFLARQLERVADHAVTIAQLTTAAFDPAEAIAQKLESYADRARTIIERGANVLVSDTHVSMAYEATEEAKQLEEDIDSFGYELFWRENPDESHRISQLLEYTKRIAEDGANMATMAIQQAASQNELDAC